MLSRFITICCDFDVACGTQSGQKNVEPEKIYGSDFN